MIVGGEGGGRWLGIDRQLRALLLSPFVRQKLGTWVSRERKEDLETLRELLESGRVTPVVDRTFPLSEVPDARPSGTSERAGRVARSSVRCEALVGRSGAAPRCVSDHAQEAARRSQPRRWATSCVAVAALAIAVR